jgi:hypothetical protein
MDGVCGTYVHKRNAHRFWRGYRTERVHLEDLDVDWRIILKQILKI